MADTQQKFFLDLGGLTTLWQKIKASFADKEETATNIGNINSSIGTINDHLEVLDNDVDNIESTVLTIAPREVNYYADAVEASKTLAVGTMIKVRYPETSAEDDTPSGYSTGIYVVTGLGEIKYVSTSDGDSEGADITSLGNRVDNLEETVIKSAQIVDGNGVQLGQGYDVNNNVLLVAHDDIFNIDSESVKALTHRAVAAKFRDVENLLTQIPKFKVAVVDELPTSEISLSTVYLLRNDKTYENNLFTEYIYVESVKDDPSTTDNESKYVWEKLGEQSLVVDDFVTNDKLNQELSIALADYAKTADVTALINTAKDEIKTDIIDTVAKTYATKEALEEVSKEIENITGDLGNYLTKDDAATTYLTQVNAAETYLSKTEADQKGWVTENDILVSIQSGNIGNAIAITDEQIDDITSENN